MADPDLGSGRIYWRLMEPMWDAFNIDVPPSKFLRAWSRYELPARHLFATHLCQCEICNGGFHQFFLNQSGILAPEAVDGFRAIGLKECADLVQQAMSFFGEPYPRAFKVRYKALSQRSGETRREWDPFYKLDARFYKRLDSEKKGYIHAADRYALQFLT